MGFGQGFGESVQAAFDAGPAVSADALAKEMQEIQVAGGPAHYVDLLGASAATPQRILAVIVPRGGQTWFIKMWGPPDLIQRHKGAFEAFVRSLEFAGGTGANRG